MSPVRVDLLAAFALELVRTDRQVLVLDTDECIWRLGAVTEAVGPSGATAVAEGVESVESVESANHHMMISRSGAELGQGFFTVGRW